MLMYRRQIKVRVCVSHRLAVLDFAIVSTVNAQNRITLLDGTDSQAGSDEGN